MTRKALTEEQTIQWLARALAGYRPDQAVNVMPQARWVAEKMKRANLALSPVETDSAGAEMPAPAARTQR